MAWAEKIHFNSEGFVLDIPHWEFPEEGITCVLGESGSGKSTLLQCLAGLIPCPGLKLSLRGELVSDLPPQARNFGFVFQDYGLFPHMTAWENIAFAPQQKDFFTRDVERKRRKINRSLKPQPRSGSKSQRALGGEQQRVALARALVTKPRLVLLDEPLSALDEKIRDEARLLMSDLSEEFKVPFLLVTHDLRDVRALSQSVLVLQNGKALASGNTQNILKNPPTLEAAAAITENQILAIEVKNGVAFIGSAMIPVSETRVHHGKTCLVAKAWSFEIVSGKGAMSAHVLRARHDGTRWQCIVSLADGQKLKAWSGLDVQPRGDMDLKIDPSGVILFKGEGL